MKNLLIIDLLITSRNGAFFHYGFRSSRLTADLLTVVSDRIITSFDRFWARRSAPIDIFRTSFYGISDQVFGFPLLFLDNTRFQVIIDGKYPFNTGVSQGFIFGPKLFLLYINDLLDLELTFELESDLRYKLENRKWLADFSSGKAKLFFFDRSNS